MKQPNEIIKKEIDKKEYLIYVYYANIKHVYLTYDDNTFIVKGSPTNILNKKFEPFLIKSIKSILKKHETLNKNKLEINKNSKEFSYFGNQVRYEIKNNYVLIFDRNNTLVTQILIKKAASDEEIIKLIKKEMSNELLAKFIFYAEQASNLILNKKYKFTYALRNKKTTWASITLPKNKINICVDLIYFSSEIIKYVAYHEICHIIHNNHSKEFWSLLQKNIPNYKILKNKLKNHIFS